MYCMADICFEIFFGMLTTLSVSVENKYRVYFAYAEFLTSINRSLPTAGICVEYILTRSVSPRDGDETKNGSDARQYEE